MTNSWYRYRLRLARHACQLNMPEYLSAKRLEELKGELDLLRDVKRKEIAKRIEEAKSLGDLSENAEYHEAREEQAFNEGKIREIEELLRDATIIEEEKSRRKKIVSVGDTIEVRKNEEEKEEFMIVGSNEADPLNGKISNESPLGRALLDRTLKEEVVVKTPSGDIHYKIIKIK